MLQLHDNIANNDMWVESTDCMLCHVTCPCWISRNVPQGYVVFYGGLRALLDLLGPYCVIG